MPTPTPSPTPSPTPTPNPLPVNTFQFIGDQSLKTALTPQLQAAVDKFRDDLNAYLDKKYPLTTNAAGDIVRAIPPAKIVIVNVLWRTFQRLASSPIIRELAKKALNELFDRVLDRIIDLLDGDTNDGKGTNKHYVGLYEDGSLIELHPLAKFVAIEFIESEKVRANAIAKNFGNYLNGTAIDQVQIGALNFVSDDFLLKEEVIGGLKTLYPVPIVPGKLSLSILPKIFCGKYKVYQFLPRDVKTNNSPTPTPSATPNP